MLFHNKCLTADNLAKRVWPHNTTCPFCNTDPETAVHLHISCSYAQDCWSQVLARTSMPALLMPSPNSESVISCWSSIATLAPANIIRRWRSLALITWWNLWKARNDRIFNNKLVSSSDLADTILQELAQWRAAGILITV